MKHLLLLLVVFLCSVGCAADGQNGSWSEALKDLRGDNMEMRGVSGWNTPTKRSTSTSTARQLPAKPASADDDDD